MSSEINNMQATLPDKQVRFLNGTYLAWLGVALLAALLWTPELNVLWHLWRSDPSLSHGPLVPIIAGALLWMRRSDLRRWDAASKPGLLLLGFTTLLYVASVWADVDFLKPLSLIGMLVGGVWFLGGLETLKATAGALGFLVFMIPWPTTLFTAVAFPLQMASSTYAALFAGLMGLPVYREGVQLYTLHNVEKPPTDPNVIYSAVVAQQCSGITSLMVLLALGYLIAYHTPVKLGWRALMVAAMVPLTLLTNTVRITIVLVVGTYISHTGAKWVHDHEGPVLIFLCSLCLLGLRHALLTWAQPQPGDTGGKGVIQIPPSNP